MLPLYDAGLDVSSYNIFQPLKEILPYDLPKCQPEEPKMVNKKTEESDGYCKACKKKFNNEATYQNHLKSAKHIANQKKMAVQKTPTQLKIPVHPQVQGRKKTFFFYMTHWAFTILIPFFFIQRHYNNFRWLIHQKILLFRLNFIGPRDRYYTS
ncbi:hypothetical protein BD560DRAFT_114925 [Blakeslea trispora]|nr:hypothetical protein BD560DRAFT_114925 [Blakeslea trispora]